MAKASKPRNVRPASRITYQTDKDALIEVKLSDFLSAIEMISGAGHYDQLKAVAKSRSLKVIADARLVNSIKKFVVLNRLEGTAVGKKIVTAQRAPEDPYKCKFGKKRLP